MFHPTEEQWMQMASGLLATTHGLHGSAWPGDSPTRTPGILGLNPKQSTLRSDILAALKLHYLVNEKPRQEDYLVEKDSCEKEDNNADTNQGPEARKHTGLCIVTWPPLPSRHNQKDTLPPFVPMLERPAPRRILTKDETTELTQTAMAAQQIAEDLVAWAHHPDTPFQLEGEEDTGAKLHSDLEVRPSE